MHQNHNIAYIYSEELETQCNRIPAVVGRASKVHSLIESYNLLSKMQVIAPRRCTEDDILMFHSPMYVNCLKNQISKDASSDESDSEDEEFGLAYDCPKLSGLWEFVKVIAGSTVTASEALLNGTKIAINWCGGWHHAQRDAAEGFCYVNDIVIGIQKLRKQFNRVLYIDLDFHHGDGVENAFLFSQSVFTLSFHQLEVGDFPGSGRLLDFGLGRGRGYAANFPYKRYMSGKNFVNYFIRTANLVIKHYQPLAIVVQCGGDVLPGDRLGTANVLPHDLGRCVTEILRWKKPTIILGGGGYNIPNTSRYWTYITALICGIEINNDIPEHEYFLDYGPGYELQIDESHSLDCNTEDELDKIIQQIERNMREYNVCAGNVG